MGRDGARPWWSYMNNSEYPSRNHSHPNTNLRVLRRYGDLQNPRGLITESWIEGQFSTGSWPRFLEAHICMQRV